MSLIPDETETFTDHAIGFASASALEDVVIFGVCSGGTAATLYGPYLTPDGVVTDLVGGPAVELACLLLSTGRTKAVWVVPINASVAGTNGSVSQTGSGPLPVLSGAPTDRFDAQLKITLAGNQSVAQFQYSLDGGVTWSPTIATAPTYAIPGSGTTVTFPYGTISAVTPAGTSPPTITLSGTPTSNVNLRVECTTLGALGTSRIRISVDGGSTWLMTNVTTAATVVVTGTGITLNIAAGAMATDNVWTATTTAVPYVLGEIYSWTAVAPYYNTTDLGAAYDAADLSGLVDWELGYVCGQVGGSSDSQKSTNAATVFAALSAKVTASEAAHRFRFLTMELPDVSDTSGGDTALATAFANLYDPRITRAYGFTDLVSAISLRHYKRSAGWAAFARLRLIALGEDPKWTGRGALPAFVAKLYHDENVRPGPGTATMRCLTLRTFSAAPTVGGFFITNYWLSSAPGSDYRYAQHRRVVDQASRLTRAKAIGELIGFPIRTYPNPAPSGKTPGTIVEEDAITIEGELNAVLTEGIVSKGFAQASTAQVNRIDVIQSTEDLRYKTRTKPFTYVSTLEAEHGFAQ